MSKSITAEEYGALLARPEATTRIVKSKTFRCTLLLLNGIHVADKLEWLAKGKRKGQVMHTEYKQFKNI